MRILDVLVVGVVLVTMGSCFRYKIPLMPRTLPQKYNPELVGDPLFLTPLIESGQIDKARNLSRVGPLKGINVNNVVSHSGFFTVNKTFNSNMFFWFFPAQENPQNAPVVLWLQGGPGASSLLGMFLEIGPFYVDKDGLAHVKNITWNQKFSMLYIDNPVGTGFSFTKDNMGYARDEVDVANNLYNALQQFFTVFPEYRKNEFYATGESYAGKYVPAITYKIYQEGAKAKINLKGMAIGDGLCDPISMLGFAPYMYQIGLLDKQQATYLQKQTDAIRKLVLNKQYKKAFIQFAELFFEDNPKHKTSFFTNTTGFTFHYNYLIANQPADFDYYNVFLQTANTRKAIHVGNLSFNNGSDVNTYLMNDWMQSVSPWIAEILDAGYKVLIYNGQLDIIIPYPATTSFLEVLEWNGANSYHSSDRHIWKLPGSNDPAGYVTVVQNLIQVLVRDAGHILPYDKPDAAMDMITRFVFNKPFY